jgi:hypothetical protein
MHGWGSRGRRFKSGRPDAGQRLVPGFSYQLLAAMGAHVRSHSLRRSSELACPACLSMLTGDYWHSARPRAGLRPSPPTRVSFPPGQGVAGSDPAVKGWFWATTAAEGRRRPAATTLSRLGPRRPAASTARAFRCSLPPPTVSPPICQLVAIQPQLRLSPTVTISTGWHPYARRQIDYLWVCDLGYARGVGLRSAGSGRRWLCGRWPPPLPRSRCVLAICLRRAAWLLCCCSGSFGGLQPGRSALGGCIQHG